MFGDVAIIIVLVFNSSSLRKTCYEEPESSMTAYMEEKQSLSDRTGTLKFNLLMAKYSQSCDSTGLISGVGWNTHMQFSH